MTPRQAAQMHCANWNNGQCSGIDFDAHGSHKAFRPRGACWLNDPVKRCSYFEECVMPMGRADWPGLKTAKEHEEFDGAIAAYRRATLLVNPNQRLCPECQLRPLEPFKRLCYICRDKHEKESRRERNRRYQDNGGSTKTES